MVPFEKQRSTPIYSKCPNHSTEQCKIFCKLCDIPICLHCASGKHLGHEAVSILKSFEAKKKVIQRDLTDLEKLIYPKYQDIASSIQVQKDDWSKNSLILTTAIDKQGEGLHREIDSIIQKIKSELDEMDSRVLPILIKQTDEITRTISKITQIIAGLKKLLNSIDASNVSVNKSRYAEFRRLPLNLTVSLSSFTPQEINNEQNFQQVGFLSAFSKQKIMATPWIPFVLTPLPRTDS